MLKTIKAVLPLKSGLVFARPANVVQFRSSPTLFTIPGYDGLLFKECSCLAEILDIGGGIAYATPNGETIIGFVGHNAQVVAPLNSAGITNPTAPLVPGASSGATPRTSCGLTLAAATSAAGFLAEYNGRHPGYEAKQLLSITPQVQTSGVGWNTPSNAVTTSHCFAIVCRADAGFIYRHKPGFETGWMSTMVTLGNMEGGMFGAYKDAVASCDPDLIKYFNEAYLEMKNEGQFKRNPKLGLVTYWGGASEFPLVGAGIHKPTTVQFGAGYVVPNLVVNGNNPSDWRALMQALHPTFSCPHLAPQLELGDPPGIPSRVKQGVAAWHRVARAAGADGCMFPIDAGAANGTGWDFLVRPYEICEKLRSNLANLAKAGVPTDPVALAGFKPSITQNEDVSRFLDMYLNTSSLITGDFVITYMEKIRALYERAEDKASDI